MVTSGEWIRTLLISHVAYHYTEKRRSTPLHTDSRTCQLISEKREHGPYIVLTEPANLSIFVSESVRKEDYVCIDCGGRKVKVTLRRAGAETYLEPSAWGQSFVKAIVPLGM